MSSLSVDRLSLSTRLPLRNSFHSLPVSNLLLTLFSRGLSDHYFSGSASSNGETTYMIPRPSPAGHVLLGGTFQADNWDTSLSIPTAHGILQRCAALAPSLLTEETRILKHGVGLRPARKGGPRIEATWAQLPLTSPLVSQKKEIEGKVLIVHAYGFGLVQANEQ